MEMSNSKQQLNNALKNDQHVTELSKYVKALDMKTTFLIVLGSLFTAIGVLCIMGILYFYFVSKQNNQIINFWFIVIIVAVSLIYLIPGIVLIVIYKDRAKKSSFAIVNINSLIKKIDWAKYYNLAKELSLPNAKWNINKILIKNVEIANLNVKYNSNTNINDENNNFSENMNSILITYKNIDMKFSVLTKINETRIVSREGNEVVTYNTDVIDFLETKEALEKIQSNILLIPTWRSENSDFQTESISFNKKYAIKTSDQFNALKIFTPSAIEKLAGINDTVKKLHSLEINQDRYISISKSHFIGKVTDYNLFSFKRHKKYEDFLNGLVNEIVEDISRLHYNFRYLSAIV